MSEQVLTFTDVEIKAKGRRLLGPLSVQLDRPGITVVMGPNGAGKSLFLSAAHGLIDLDHGYITWNGIPAKDSRASRGFVFQTTPILRRSVAGNIGFPLLARGMDREEKQSRIEAALTEARLLEDANKPAAALSGGERKRLALAQALVNHPDVILLDEPAANLDPASTAEFEESLRRISASGTRIILSTHDVAQARRIADFVLFFANGQIVEQAEARDFFHFTSSEEAKKFLRGDL